MKRSWVRSRSVRSLGYDADTATLEIEFCSGAVYRYFLVPARIARLLRTAPSIGSFVNQVIKPGFAAARVGPAGAHDTRAVARRAARKP